MSWPVYNPPNGPGKGTGWGGPARGEPAKGDHLTFAASGEQRALGKRSPERLAELEERRRRARELKDELYQIAKEDPLSTTRITAAVAWLNREEGMPIARNLNVNENLASELNDDELVARREELDRAIRRTSGGDSQETRED